MIQLAYLKVAIMIAMMLPLVMLGMGVVDGVTGEYHLDPDNMYNQSIGVECDTIPDDETARPGINCHHENHRSSDPDNLIDKIDRWYIEQFGNAYKWGILVGELLQ